MKKALLLLCLISFESFSQTWAPLPNFSSHERDDAAAFVIGNKAYCGSGLSPWFSALADFRVLDMTTDSWSSISDLPPGEQRQYALGFSANGKGYVFGGVDGGKYFRNVLEYDPLLDNWTPKTSLPDSGISGAASFVINNVAYVICGRTAKKSATNTVWAYDITNDTWQQKTDFPYGDRWLASGASLNGKGYLIFGADSVSNLQNTFYEYDPVLDLWAPLSPFPGPGRNYSSLTAINGQLIVFGGIDSAGVYQNDLWRYNPLSQIWHQQKSLPAKGRKGGLAFTDGTALYYTTGIDNTSTRLNETWKCDNPLIGLAENNAVEFDVYPNPASQYVQLNFKGNKNAPSKLLIYNLSGMVVLEESATNLHGRLDISHLPEGVYVMEIIWQQWASQLKLIKY